MNHSTQQDDPSNGYEALAGRFASGRTPIGAAAVRRWSATLPPSATVLDLGCGPGIPISQTLINGGFHVYGIDASPGMVAAFRRHFPGVPCECAPVEQSTFFDRSFEGVIAWGLIFLLAPEAQAQLIHRVAQVLKPGGRFLFTAPREILKWADNLTGRASYSLGEAAYRKLLEDAGLALIGDDVDEGENYYYLSVKQPLPNEQT